MNPGSGGKQVHLILFIAKYNSTARSEIDAM
jgi:hypothetical protein